jgi:hypothetical protein
MISVSHIAQETKIENNILSAKPQGKTSLACEDADETVILNGIQSNDLLRCEL